MCKNIQEFIMQLKLQI